MAETDPWAQFRASKTEGDPWSQFRADQPAASMGSEGPDVTTDVAKQAGAGLVTGLEAIPAATPSAIGWLGRQVERVYPGNQEAISQREQLLRTIQAQRGGGMAQYLPTPQTEAGQLTRAAAETVPGMVASVGGSIPRAIGMGAAAGAAGEAAGQATEGTAAEPYARIGASLAGAGAAGRIMGRTGFGLPTRSQVDDLAKGLYGKSDEATIGLAIPRQELSVFGEKLRNDLNRAGVRMSTGKGAHDVVDDIVKTSNPDVYDLVKYREVAKDLYKSSNGGDRRGAPFIVNALEQEINRLSPMGASILKAADREYSIGKTMESLDKRQAKVIAQTASTGSGLNLQNKYKQSLTQLLTNEKAVRGLKPDELAHINRTIMGNPIENTIRLWGNRLGGGGGIGSTLGGFAVGGGAGLATGHDPGASAMYGLGVMGLGRGLRGIGNQITRSNVNKLNQMVARRSALAQGAPPSYPGMGLGAYGAAVYPGLVRQQQ